MRHLECHFFNRSRVEAFGEDPWARYNRGNAQQGPMVEPLSPYSDTDFNHVIFGGWNFDTPRRIIVSDDERVMSAVTSEQRTFIRRHVVFGQRAQTAHIFLKELTDPPADRFFTPCRETTTRCIGQPVEPTSGSLHPAQKSVE